jgi:hypothetical protein
VIGNEQLDEYEIIDGTEQLLKSRVDRFRQSKKVYDC